VLAVAALAAGCDGTAGLETREIVMTGAIRSNGTQAVASLSLQRQRRYAYEPAHLTGDDELLLGPAGALEPLTWTDDRGYAGFELDPDDPAASGAFALEVIRGRRSDDVRLPLSLPPQGPIVGPAGPVSRSGPFSVEWEPAPLVEGEGLGVWVEGSCIEPSVQGINPDEGRFEVQPASLRYVNGFDCPLYVTVIRSRTVYPGCDSGACVTGTFTLEQIRRVAVETTQ
jgi:hypothetical protein